MAHQFTCPAGLYFNKAADSCDFSQNVLCNKKLSKTTTPTYTTTKSAKLLELTKATTTVKTTKRPISTVQTTSEKFVCIILSCFKKILFEI